MSTSIRVYEKQPSASLTRALNRLENHTNAQSAKNLTRKAPLPQPLKSGQFGSGYVPPKKRSDS